MAARRLILVMLVLLVLSSVAAALVPVDDRGTESSSSTTSTSAPELPTGGFISRSVDAAAKDPSRIRAAAGDQLELVVTSPRPAQVAIRALDELEDTDPEFAARFDLLLLDTGKYPVEAIETDGGKRRRIATIVVK